jgi:hypothetical protein
MTPTPHDPDRQWAPVSFAGLTLVQAAGRYGALSVRKNSIIGPMPIEAAATSDSRRR